jgi:hypothetical protein
VARLGLNVSPQPIQPAKATYSKKTVAVRILAELFSPKSYRTFRYHESPFGAGQAKLDSRKLQNTPGVDGEPFRPHVYIDTFRLRL